MNFGVLASGRGTNLQALIERSRRGELGPARLTVVGSNVPDTPAQARALAAGPVLEDDDAESLRARVLAEEHRLLPAVVRAIAEHRVVVENGRVRVLGDGPSGDVLRSL